MRFSIFSTALMALGATAANSTIATNSTASATALTANDLATSIGTLTAKSQTLLESAGALNLANAALLLELITGLEDMANTAKQQIVEIQTLESPTKLAGGEAQLVTNALKGLLSVVSELLKTVTGKAGLVTSLPIVGQVLAPVLSLVDNLVTTLLDTVINQLDDVLGEALKLDLPGLSTVTSVLPVAGLATTGLATTGLATTGLATTGLGTTGLGTTGLGLAGLGV